MHELFVADEFSSVFLTVMEAETVDIVAFLDMLDDGKGGKTELLIALVLHHFHILRHPPNKLVLIMAFTDSSLKKPFSTSSLVAGKSPHAEEVHCDQDIRCVIDDAHIPS